MFLRQGLSMQPCPETQCVDQAWTHKDPPTSAYQGIKGIQNYAPDADFKKQIFSPIVKKQKSKSQE